jgi:hypothetical protein
MMMLNFDGSKKFHEYYRSPGKSAFGAILAGAIAVTSMAVATSAAYEAGMNRNNIGQYNDRGRQAKIIQDGFSDIAAASFKELNKRFKASSSTENNHFVLTKLDGGVGLVRLNKDSGKKDKEVVLKDKEPEYEVDDIMGYMFYKQNDRTIQMFNLN